MKKSVILTMALLLIAGLALAQNVLVYSTEGEYVNAGFVKIENNRLFLNINGQLDSVDVNEVAVLIFDNGYTNFYKDRDSHGGADPNMIVMKRDQNYFGRAAAGYASGKLTMTRSAGGYFEIPMHEIARIYFNPRPFFQKAVITGNNSIEWDNGNKQTTPDNNRKKDKKKNKKNRNKPAQNVQKLGGGMVAIQFRNSSSTTGIIFDAQGRDLELVLRDNRRFNMRSIKMINYEEVKFNYPSENKLKKPGFATFILRGGGVMYGQIIDYRGQGEWELAGGQRIRWNQVKRIYF